MKRHSLRNLAPLNAGLEEEFPVLLRPIGPHDVDRVNIALQRLSRESFRSRFSRPSPDQQLSEYLCNHENSLTWVALNPNDPDFHGFGGASLWPDSDIPNEAEMSLTIGDEWQRKGLGCLLFSILWIEGWEYGIRNVVGYARSSNLAILNWWSGLGGTVEIDNLSAQLEFELVAPDEYVQNVEYDLHAKARQFELANWLRHWLNLIEESSPLYQS